MKFSINKTILIISIISAVLISSILLVFVFKESIEKPLKINAEEVLLIDGGDSFYTVLEKLKEENKIKNTLVIKIYVKIFKLNLEVLPGEYTISNSMSVKEMLEAFGEASINSRKLTIPEGFSIDDIAYRLEEMGVCTASEFIDAVKLYPLPEYVKVDSAKRYNLEGYLFPDTYNITNDTTVNNIIEIMLNRFEEVWSEVTQKLDIKIDNSNIERILTIASMVEKESGVDEERALISSVIYNRVKEDMLLQIDATVLYAHGYHIEQVLYSHLELDSPYNTYLYKGLPVGPICNPGVPSIIAAIKPENTDYLFYLLETENKHYFTNNDDDFLKRKEELGY